MLKRLFGKNSSRVRDLQSRLDKLERDVKKTESLREKLRDLEQSPKKLQRDFQKFIESTITGRFDDLRCSLVATLSGHESLPREMERLMLLCGRQAAQRSRSLPPESPLADAEFRTFSQWGEDGIIQFLLGHVPIENEKFVEFGVQDYSEANTRFLLMNDNWRGLILDGSEPWMAAVRNSELAWRYDLTAKEAWVTAENINELLSSAGIRGDIGLLSVDVDGVDYWVWKAINVVNPRIVVCEYNSVFGPNAAVTAPYDPQFMRDKAHSSNLFYGVSLAAIEALGKEKGYQLIGSNSAGNNAFLVREDLVGNLKVRTAREAWRQSRFREARDASGALIYATADQCKHLIADCMVHDLTTGKNAPLRELPDWKVA